MKTAFSALLFLLFTLAVQGQKIINDPNAQVREVKSFQGISVSGGIDLYISPGEEAVAVSASKPEIANEIKTEVEDGILKISFNTNKIRDILKGINSKAKAYVSYRTLNSLSAVGGCNIHSDGTISGNFLKIDVTGGSNFNGKVDVKELKAELTGGSDIKINGSATKLDVRATGGCDFKGYDLQADICDLSAVGASDIQLTANKELSAKATGASDIHYKGKPEVKEAKATGASDIVHES
ncbi:MAG: head GIN domain-containing protein [Candidatus Dadabacteria bacterium]